MRRPSPLQLAGAAAVAIACGTLVYRAVPGEQVPAPLFSAAADPMAIQGGASARLCAATAAEAERAAGQLAEAMAIATRTVGDTACLTAGFAGLSEDAAARVLDRALRWGPLTFRFVVENARSSRALYDAAQLDHAAGRAIAGHEDGWAAPDGQQRTDVYVAASSRGELDAWIATTGVAPEPGTELFVEDVPASPDRAAHSRTVVVEVEPIIRGDDIAAARVEYSEYTNQPEVHLTLDEDAAVRFADATRRGLGRKLAIAVGDAVVSAPVIMSLIAGGEVAISLGASWTDPAAARLEAEAMARLLGGPPTDVVLRLEHIEMLAPAITGDQLRGARIRFAAVCGLALGLLALVAFLLAPRTSEPPTATRSTPWMRLAITVGGALAIAVSAQVPLPTIDDAALDRLAGWTSDVPGLFWLGIVPVISAMGVVEIVALAVPRWRKLRHGGPQGRARLARASATLAVALALVQGWFIATWLMSFDSFGAGSLLRVDIPFPRMATVLSLAAGTLVILLFAAAVGRLGLASPISLVLGAGLAAEIVQSMWALGAERLLEASPPAHAPLILGAIIAIAIATWRTLRRRANADGRPAYRLPTSGLIPLATASSLLVLVSSLETLGLVPPIWLHRILAPATTAGHAVYLALAALLAVGCSWLFSRPSLVAALCPGRVDPAATSATRSAFAGATAASVGFVIALGILGSALSSTVPAIAVSVISVATLTAIVMDVVDEWRARRAAAADLVDVWPLHQVPAIDLVLAALRRDGIAAHARGANHRALLHFFGPHVPIAILVPRPDAERARALIASLFVSAA